MNETTIFGKKVPWLFFLSLIGQVVSTALIGSYLSFYMTENMKITAGIMGGVLLASRMVDMVMGLAVGPFVQKHCGRHGQFRTWLFYAPIIIAVGCCLCFINPDIPPAAKAIIVFIGYAGYGGGMSILQLAQNGIMSKVAGPDMNARQTITGRIAQGQALGLILTSLISLPLVTFFCNMGKDGYTIVQILYALVGVCLQMFLFAGTRDYEKYDPDFLKANSSAAVKITTMYKNTLKNGQLVILIIADMVKWTGMMTLMTMMMYYFTYAVGDRSKMTLAMLAYSVTTLAGAFVGTSISKKIGKKNSALATGIITAVGYGGVGFFTNGSPWLFIVFICIAALGDAIVKACGVNLFLDAAEYQLYRTGSDNRTLAMSMFGIPIKLGMALSSVAVAMILQLGGYNELTLTVSNIDFMVKLIGGVPALCYLAYFVLMLVYGITEEKSREYAVYNHEHY